MLKKILILGLLYTTSIFAGTITSSVTGKVWMDKNLGASQVCTSFDDSNCYGDYYQWGRDTDGHQVSTSDTNLTQATSTQCRSSHRIAQ